MKADKGTTREFWRRADQARRAGLISYGALAYLQTLARLARSRGDGLSFCLGERIIEEIAGFHRNSCRRWRAQLLGSGFISFDPKWANKRGWFWEARTTLLVEGVAPAFRAQNVPGRKGESSGHKMCPESGHKMCPSLNREDTSQRVKDLGRAPAKPSPVLEGGNGRPAQAPATLAGEKEAVRVGAGGDARAASPSPEPASMDAKGPQNAAALAPDATPRPENTPGVIVPRAVLEMEARRQMWLRAEAREEKAASPALAVGELDFLRRLREVAKGAKPDFSPNVKAMAAADTATPPKETTL